MGLKAGPSTQNIPCLFCAAELQWTGQGWLLPTGVRSRASPKLPTAAVNSCPRAEVSVSCFTPILSFSFHSCPLRLSISPLNRWREPSSQRLKWFLCYNTVSKQQRLGVSPALWDLKTWDLHQRAWRSKTEQVFRNRAWKTMAHRLNLTTPIIYILSVVHFFYNKRSELWQRICGLQGPEV